MLVLSLCQRLCPEKIPVQPGERISDGADGEVFTIHGDPDKVLKLSVLYDSPARPLNTYLAIQKVLDHVMHVQPQAVVRVYEHGYLGIYTRPEVIGAQYFLLYYYIMQKLQKISEDERKVFHSLLSHEDRNIVKHFSGEKIREMVTGMSRGLDFDEKKVILFCNNLRSTGIIHQDIDTRNIMKNCDGDFRLVDLDRTIMENDNDQ
jgi:serine/threonine protein kinase